MDWIACLKVVRGIFSCTIYDAFIFMADFHAIASRSRSLLPSVFALWRYISKYDTKKVNSANKSFPSEGINIFI